ncbi:MAG TPA: hypothetical protein IGS52_07840 [Oscillatoriaceae cyanobacterium M33_DOE_052]|nr:hypothetical protein [Oscillatoriaceae cyanobacterium M33_DOE_052]
MTIAKKKEREFSLRVGQTWKSFEQFRLEGAKTLSAVKERVIATLHTKSGQYRIIEEHDFQTLYGLARDVDRLRGGLQVVVLAVRAAQKHPDETHLKLLAEAVAMLGNLPELPVRDAFDALEPETSDGDDEDEVILDLDRIPRPLRSPKLPQPNGQED